MRKRVLTILGLLLVAGGATAGAQDIAREQTRLLAKRAAEADAYRKLAEAVYGLQINSKTYVRDFVTESDEIRTDVDSFVKGVRLGTPTYYDDGSCEVPAEVTVAKVVETLRQAHSRYYKGEDVKTEDFETLTKRIDKQVLKVTGMGAPRPDLPPNLPQGTVELLTPAPAPTAGKPPVPGIWSQVGPQARLMAIRAARVDALRRLAERIKGLRLTSKTQVRDFVAESDTISTELNALLVGAEEVGYYLHSDELIAEVTMKVSTEQVIETIKTLHSRHYKGDDVRGHDIEDVVKTIVKRDFEATGQGIPPPQYLQKYAETLGFQMPEWVAQPLEAEGHGTDPDMSAPQGRLRAARAAELDARRKLAERIVGLRLQGETTVKDSITQHDELSAFVDAVIVDAIATETKFTDTTATVKVSVPGMRVWQVFSQGLGRGSGGPPRGGAPAPSPAPAPAAPPPASPGAER